MKKILAIALISCHPALCGYGGYILFQTVPSMAGSSLTSPYSLLISGTFSVFATVANGGKVVNTVSCGVDSIACPADLIFAEDSGCTAPFAGWDVQTYSPATESSGKRRLAAGPGLIGFAGLSRIATALIYLSGNLRRALR